MNEQKNPLHVSFQVFFKSENNEEIRRLSKNSFFQKQEGRGSEDFEEQSDEQIIARRHRVATSNRRSRVNLNEHREIEADEEIRRLSKNEGL